MYRKPLSSPLLSSLPLCTHSPHYYYSLIQFVWHTFFQSFYFLFFSLFLMPNSIFLISFNTKSLTISSSSFSSSWMYAAAGGGGKGTSSQRFNWIFIIIRGLSRAEHRNKQQTATTRFLVDRRFSDPTTDAAAYTKVASNHEICNKPLIIMSVNLEVSRPFFTSFRLSFSCGCADVRMCAEWEEANLHSTTDGADKNLLLFFFQIWIENVRPIKL